jgi:type II secretory pathway component PulK
MRSDRDGFALLAVLWVIVAVSALALMAQLAARESVAAARNREELTRAAWRAEECGERARAAVSATLRAARLDGPSGASWNRIPAAVAESPLTQGCEITVRAAGTAIDANTADAETLHRLFQAMGATPETADSLRDALLDWRDLDHEPRPSGAEADAYARAGRFAPRDGPFADPAELRRVRGFERFPGVDSLLGVEPGRIPLGQAPLPVLAALPGFTPQAVARIAELRLRGEAVPEAMALGGSLADAPRAELMRRGQELALLTTNVPEAWVVTARARVGAPPVTAAIELRLVRAGDRPAIVRRRTWVE